jgi:prefoldin alpha subunit
MERLRQKGAFMAKEITVSSDGKAGEKPSQERLQERLLLFQLMEKQLEILKQQGTLAGARTAELETAGSTLRDIESLRDSNEILVPLGGGLYTKARVTSKEMLAELGAGVVMKKSIKAAGDFLDERKRELMKAADQIEEQAGELVERLNELGPEIQRMAAQAEKE